MDLFTTAVKTGLNFQTSRGVVLPQDLWNMPLTCKGDFNLDTISRDLLKKIRSTQEDSLVSVSKVDSVDELRLEVLKFIIADKQAEAAASKLAVANKQERDVLLALKAKKQQDQLGALTVDEIEAKLSALGK